MSWQIGIFLDEKEDCDTDDRDTAVSFLSFWSTALVGHCIYKWMTGCICLEKNTARTVTNELVLYLGKLTPSVLNEEQGDNREINGGWKYLQIVVFIHVMNNIYGIDLAMSLE